jgi:hypothetical protein
MNPVRLMLDWRVVRTNDGAPPLGVLVVFISGAGAARVSKEV